jgi:hypothetical protein
MSLIPARLKQRMRDLDSIDRGWGGRRRVHARKIIA